MISHIEVVQKENIYGYRGGKASPFLKLFLMEARHIGKVKGLFERGEVSLEHFFSNGGVTTYESNISHDLRFMIDRKVTSQKFIVALLTIRLWV